MVAASLPALPPAAGAGAVIVNAATATATAAQRPQARELGNNQQSRELRQRRGRRITAAVAAAGQHDGAIHAHPRADLQLSTPSLIRAAITESMTARSTLAIAEELFTRIVLDRTAGFGGRGRRHGGGGGGTESGGGGGGGGGGGSNSGATRGDADAFDIGHTRIAICCLFLERLCAAFPRHNAAVRPVAEAIVRSIFVPDTQVTRELVGGLDCPIVVGDDVPGEVVELLRPYARKTYAAAFSRISSMLKRYSKTSHSLEVRLRRQAQVFERTLAHWRKTLLRSVFVAWRSTIRRRVFLRAKYRAIFMRLREDECRARAIRMWHQRAIRLRKAALADAALQHEMSKLKLTSEGLQAQILALLDQNATLSRDVAELERQRQLIQQEMLDRDRFVVDMSHRTVEAERLGTELINSVLMGQDPPGGATPLESMVRWGHEVIDVAGAIDGAAQPLLCLLSDEITLPNFSFAALGTILGAFDVDGAPTREAVMQMHVNPDAAPALLVQFYGRVTQRPPIVTEAHLRSRQRGVLLLFLASLMRYASSWMFGPPPLNLRERIITGATAANNGNNNMGSSNSSGGFAPGSSTAQQTGAAGGNVAGSPGGASSKWMERVRTQQRWVVVSLSAMNAALLIASDRPQVLSAEEQEDEPRYCSLTGPMLEDLLPTSQQEERLALVLKCVKQAYPEMRKLYLTYSSPAMSIDECWRLLKDSRLAGSALVQLSKRKLMSLVSTARRLTHMYAATAPTAAGAAAGAAAGLASSMSSSPSRRDGSTLNDTRMLDASASVVGHHLESSVAGNHHHHHTNINSNATGGATGQGAANPGGPVELTPQQFVVVLLHVALAEHRRQMRLDNPEALFFEPFMLENAMRAMRDKALRADIDQFRHVVRHPLVQSIIARQKIPLRRAFRKFANCDEGESMNRVGFHNMARACAWLCRTVTIETLNDIFRRVQRADDAQAASMNSSAPSAGDTIDLSEWIECICAIATFTFPNPFKPLWEKHGSFVEEKVIVALGV